MPSLLYEGMVFESSSGTFILCPPISCAIDMLSQIQLSKHSHGSSSTSFFLRRSWSRTRKHLCERCTRFPRRCISPPMSLPKASPRVISRDQGHTEAMERKSKRLADSPSKPSQSSPRPSCNLHRCKSIRTRININKPFSRRYISRNNTNSHSYNRRNNTNSNSKSHSHKTVSTVLT
jgi:hypothetical protein